MSTELGVKPKVVVQVVVETPNSCNDSSSGVRTSAGSSKAKATTTRAERDAALRLHVVRAGLTELAYRKACAWGMSLLEHQLLDKYMRYRDLRRKGNKGQKIERVMRCTHLTEQLKELCTSIHAELKQTGRQGKELSAVDPRKVAEHVSRAMGFVSKDAASIESLRPVLELGELCNGRDIKDHLQARVGDSLEHRSRQDLVAMLLQVWQGSEVTRFEWPLRVALTQAEPFVDSHPSESFAMLRQAALLVNEFFQGHADDLPPHQRKLLKLLTDRPQLLSDPRLGSSSGKRRERNAKKAATLIDSYRAALLELPGQEQQRARHEAAMKAEEKDPEEPPAWTGPKPPKRALSAFIYFCMARRPLLQAERPGVDNAGLTKLMGQEWRDADPSAKQFFIERQEKDKERYQEEKVCI